MTSDEQPVFTVETLERDLELAHLERFGQEDAYTLGTIAADIIRERQLTMAVQVVLGEHIVYKAAFGGVPEETTDWLRRKSNAAKLRGEPSLLVRRRVEFDGMAVAEAGLEDADVAAHGGAVPLFVNGDLVGTITTSGEPDVVDHQVAIDTVRRYREPALD